MNNFAKAYRYELASHKIKITFTRVLSAVVDRRRNLKVSDAAEKKFIRSKYVPVDSFSDCLCAPAIEFSIDVRFFTS